MKCRGGYTCIIYNVYGKKEGEREREKEGDGKGVASFPGSLPTHAIRIFKGHTYTYCTCGERTWE